MLRMTPQTQPNARSKHYTPDLLLYRRRQSTRVRIINDEDFDPPTSLFWSILSTYTPFLLGIVFVFAVATAQLVFTAPDTTAISRLMKTLGVDVWPTPATEVDVKTANVPNVGDGNHGTTDAVFGTPLPWP